MVHHTQTNTQSIDTITMDTGAIDMLFGMRPFLKGVPKMRKFLSQGGHIKLEKADDANNIKWMEACAEKGYIFAMIAHREGCRGVFNFSNFDRWIDSDYPMTWIEYQGTAMPAFEIDKVWYQYIPNKGLKLIEGFKSVLDSEIMPSRVAYSR